MRECEKIEKLFWDYPDITAAEKEELSSHLETCPSCRTGLEAITSMRESRELDREFIKGVDSNSFENAVMARIESRKRRSVARSDDRRFIFRTVASVGLAAAIVVFIMASISDLGNLPALKKTEMEAVEDTFEMEIRLAPPEIQLAPRGASKLGYMQGMESAAEPFSILDKPVTAPAPDSVSIGAVYLSDEAVPLESQQARASISEVIVDTGMIQAAWIPEAILVTVEKMPRAIDIVPPEYPVWGRKRGLSAVVWVKARIDENGTVTDAEAIGCNISGAGFEDAALEAARKSRYLPAEANGIGIPVWIVYPVKFIYTK